MRYMCLQVLKWSFVREKLEMKLKTYCCPDKGTKPRPVPSWANILTIMKQACLHMTSHLETCCRLGTGKRRSVFTRKFYCCYLDIIINNNIYFFSKTYSSCRYCENASTLVALEYYLSVACPNNPSSSAAIWRLTRINQIYF